MPQVFHVNIDTLELAVEQFEEPISCLALRQNGAGVSFEAFCIIFLTRASSWRAPLPKVLHYWGTTPL